MAVNTTSKNDDWTISSVVWMKKLTIGIKENDKIIFLRTEEVSDEFDSQKLIKAMKTIIDIFVKRNKGGYYVKTNNEFDSMQET